MSWSFHAIGKPGAVLGKARNDLVQCKCAEPEETIKGKVLNILEAALLAFPDSSAVHVTASGSQSTAYNGPAVVEGRFTNSLSIEIKPIYGFVE